MDRCRICYAKLAKDAQSHYHPACARKLFGQPHPPVIDVSVATLDAIAERYIRSKGSVTGVQPKLSLGEDKGEKTKRLTVVGYSGKYILKPQSVLFKQLPENEHLTMRLAKTLILPVAEAGLVYLVDGSLAYLTLRFDRTNTGLKYGMEDMAQLTETLTEYKYRGSVEKIAKVINKYSAVAGQDKLYLFYMVLFTWLTGNSDMHLKNFSMLETAEGWRLSPAYDLINTQLAMPEDKEQFALTLNGKRNRLTKADLIDHLGSTVLELPAKVIENTQKRFNKALQTWPDLINASFLTDEAKQVYHQIVAERAAVLGLDYQYEPALLSDTETGEDIT